MDMRSDEVRKATPLGFIGSLTLSFLCRHKSKSI